MRGDAARQNSGRLSGGEGGVYPIRQDPVDPLKCRTRTTAIEAQDKLKCQIPIWQISCMDSSGKYSRTTWKPKLPAYCGPCCGNAISE